MKLEVNVVRLKKLESEMWFISMGKIMLLMLGLMLEM